MITDMPTDVLRRLREMVVLAAGEELMPRFAEIRRSIKADGSVVTAADTAMQSRMQADLARVWPQYGFLGEEMSEEEQSCVLREGGAGLWCLDPLDGTSNYASGIPYFAVSLALLIDGRPVLGLVFDPVRAECFMAQRDQGVWLNDAPLAQRPAPPALRRCIAGVDFKRLKGHLAARLGEDPPYGSQRNFGASSLDWCWLAAGRLQLYLHGGQKLWDYAAGSLIHAEAGGLAETLEGESVCAGDLRPRSVVAAGDAELFEAWRTWIRFNFRSG
jgi:myo-inositol-1(or 4)-monophosphatase